VGGEKRPDVNFGPLLWGGLLGVGVWAWYAREGKAGEDDGAVERVDRA
jgi:hypothetical protein